MSANAQVICYGIAVVAFLLAAVSGLTGRWNPSGMALVGLGLAPYVFPTFWNTLAIS